MALPKLDYAIFNVKLPTTGKMLKIRPYRVKEEKIMLLARETKDPIQITEAIEQILRNCVLDDSFDPKKLATVDLDVLLLKLRAISGGETIDLRYAVNCDDPKCNKVGEATINLNEYTLPPIKPAPKIQLSDRVMVTLRYPSLYAVKKVSSITDPLERASMMIALCLDQIVEGEEVMHADDYPIEELLEWIDTFPQDKQLPIVEFFSDIPEVNFMVDFKCKKCGKVEKVKISGLESFFA